MNRNNMSHHITLSLCQILYHCCVDYLYCIQEKSISDTLSVLCTVMLLSTIVTSMIVY